MRIWSLHPRYLDRLGLVACWRETLLAQAVLAGRTKGYTAHPQLTRWRATPDPQGALAAYLSGIVDEADARGYRFDRGKIATRPVPTSVPVTSGQLDYEWEHLRQKLLQRNSEWLTGLGEVGRPEAHPVLQETSGDVESWEVR